MTPPTTAPPGRTAADARARAAALVSGATGIAANAFLGLFYALAAPFSGNGSGAGWLGTVSDWLEVAQFLALVPVVTALGRRVAASRPLRVVTVAGAAAMATTAAAQLLLVAGLLRFEV